MRLGVGVPQGLLHAGFLVAQALAGSKGVKAQHMLLNWVCISSGRSWILGFGLSQLRLPSGLCADPHKYLLPGALVRSSLFSCGQQQAAETSILSSISVKGAASWNISDLNAAVSRKKESVWSPWEAVATWIERLPWCQCLLIWAPHHKSHSTQTWLSALVQSLHVKSTLKQYSRDGKPSIQYLGKARFKVSSATQTSLEVSVASSLSQDLVTDSSLLILLV